MTSRSTRFQGLSILQVDVQSPHEAIRIPCRLGHRPVSHCDASPEATIHSDI